MAQVSIDQGPGRTDRMFPCILHKFLRFPALAGPSCRKMLCLTMTAVVKITEEKKYIVLHLNETIQNTNKSAFSNVDTGPKMSNCI